ncbi:MAG: hypothetical protein V4773_13465 [Verrucomicrobiota bacterium]
MSTAILISGQLRTFARCWPTQRWHVLRHFADPHFFITVQDGPEIQLTDDLKREYGADRVHVDGRTDPDLSQHLTPELARAYHQAPYTNAAPAHQLLLQHWYQAECWKHFAEVRGQKSGVSFDTIIRMRADLWFHSLDWSDQSDLCPLTSGTAFTPGWGEFGGINDRFAIMGPEAARHYFTVWDHIPELLAAGCPFHPESLVAAALERGNVDLHRTLKTFFSTERLDGTRRWPEITPMDMLNASLRNAA